MGFFRIVNKIRGAFLPLIMICLLIGFVISVSNIGTGYSEQEEQQLETAIRRGAAACYATEGVYPESLDYLAEHYGIKVDDTRYIVHYEVFAENVMPSITVFRNK